MSAFDAEFADRREAGRLLAAKLAPLALPNPLVLALPRGGVPVAFEVALALRAPLDLLLVRKIGAPGQAEYGIGAVVEGDVPHVVLTEDAIRIVQPSAEYLEAETKRQIAELARRRKAYLGNSAPLPRAGRSLIVVDDGIATGGTMRAALQALRRAGAAQVVPAVPVSPPDVLDSLRGEADIVVCIATPEHFRAVGLHYRNFEQTTDEEVVSLLEAAGRVAVEMVGPAGLEPATTPL